MKKRTWKIFAVLVGIGLLGGLFYFPVASGLALGTLISAILYLRNVSFWNDVVDTGIAGRGTGSFHFLINYALMAEAMILCALKPQYLNIFACAIGLAMVKLSLVVESLLYKGKEEV